MSSSPSSRSSPAGGVAGVPRASAPPAAVAGVAAATAAPHTSRPASAVSSPVVSSLPASGAAGHSNRPLPASASAVSSHPPVSSPSNVLTLLVHFPSQDPMTPLPVPVYRDQQLVSLVNHPAIPAMSHQDKLNIKFFVSVGQDWEVSSGHSPRMRSSLRSRPIRECSLTVLLPAVSASCCCCSQEVDARKTPDQLKLKPNTPIGIKLPNL